ncbi:MAG: hypothetical protein ACJ751_15315, partial [Niastella sp.]|uniref:hypothetical protein n=1 Tax=Niastella sp. TaxID=1869183 RepID=UPI00389A892A
MCLRVLQLSCLLALFQCCFLNGFSQNVLSPYPIDACTTYTFRSQTGDAAYDNHINDMYGNSTGNSFQVGYTTINGNQDGLLQQLDINGKVVWSKTFGNSSLNERIQSIGKLPDGTLVMTGTIENTNGTNQHPFVAAADMAGTFLWIKSIQTATDYRGAYVLATKTGTIGVVAEDDSTMLYARFNTSGNIAWLKKVQALPKSKTVGMVEDVRWFIGYTGEEGGRKIGGIIVIDSLTGNIVRTKQFGGGATNSDFIFHSLQLINIRPRITGIYSENNQPYKLFRMSSSQANDFQTVGFFETFNTPTINFDATAFSTQSTWS